MQYIQELLDLTQNYWVLATIIGLLSAFIESFIPALPLVAIVTANAAI
ncbi:TPA: TVP38/TMEM64 family protein, partial [Clostridioides difficile]|nr:TVP38/TMEM64 family protein [Clostridioides difficile]